MLAPTIGRPWVPAGQSCQGTKPSSGTISFVAFGRVCVKTNHNSIPVGRPAGRPRPVAAGRGALLLLLKLLLTARVGIISYN